MIKNKQNKVSHHRKLMENVKLHTLEISVDKFQYFVFSWRQSLLNWNKISTLTTTSII